MTGPNGDHNGRMDLDDGLVVTLEAGDVRVRVWPRRGGRVGQIEVGGRPLLKCEPDGNPMTWGSFPMVPWAGRVRDGRFGFRGATYRLPQNLPPHAIHGTAFDRPWTVDDSGRDHCDLGIDLGWALGGSAHQHLQLDEQGLTCVLTVYADRQSMPAVIGWHPCFLKPRSADLHFARTYRRDDQHVALPELVPAPAGPWDDCFVEPLAPVRLHHDGLEVTVSSDCDHWVVYDEPTDVTCVEPQSGPPDAFNMPGRAAVLEPGDLLQRRMVISWARSV